MAALPPVASMGSNKNTLLAKFKSVGNFS